MSGWRRRLRLRGPASRGLLALFFIVAGILHFVFPEAYRSVMPPWLPWPAALVAISGVAECAGGFGVLWPPVRRRAGIGLLVLCVAVLPANVQMLRDALDTHRAGWIIALLVLRLPLQLVLMGWIRGGDVEQDRRKLTPTIDPLAGTVAILARLVQIQHLACGFISFEK